MGKNPSLHIMGGFVGKDVFAFWGKKTSRLFPMWGRIALHFGKESSTPYPCGEKFRGKDSLAFQGEESLTPFPMWISFVGRDSCAFGDWGEEKV